METNADIPLFDQCVNSFTMTCEGEEGEKEKSNTATSCGYNINKGAFHIFSKTRSFAILGL